MAPYKAFALRARGVREVLDIQSLIVELRPGVEIEIDLAPHPKFAGDLVIFTPPTKHMQRLHKAGKIDSFAVFFGAANVLHVRVERRVGQQKGPVRVKQPQRPKASPGKNGVSGEVARSGAGARDGGRSAMKIPFGFTGGIAEAGGDRNLS